MCLISIIIPIYNTKRYLRECLESVLAQTYVHWECLCIDDGSMDDSAETVKEYAGLDHRIVLIQTDNNGASHARNLGLELACGSWVYFLDSDDVLHKECLATAMNLYASHQADMIVMNYRKFASVSDIQACGVRQVPPQVSISPMKEVLEGALEVPLMLCGKFYSRELLCGMRFDETMACYEDTLFSLELIRRSVKMAKTDCELYYYRVNPDSLTVRSDFARQLECVSENLRKAVVFERECLNDKKEEIRYHILAGGLLFWILCKNAIVRYSQTGDKDEIARVKDLYLTAKRRRLLRWTREIVPIRFRLVVCAAFDMGMLGLLAKTLRFFIR